ncbi:ferrous iron transport protein B [Candidatus Methanomassiliicoccus intestinalis]|uniref:ferrous iron transport protein B n=1 Tax=Candidatus Methanomassiliicoccus intestinalis TaxID=1406512 RepID=UPI0037DDA586
MKIALVGNPNVGKSVLFTRMTGVGVIASNYAGTTVEFEEATVIFNGKTITVFDLPGTYSFSGVTEDEQVAIELLEQKSPDRVISVVDATRLSQSLVLTLQLIELGYDVVLALNFMDQAKKRYTIDVEMLSSILKIPVIPITATTGEGTDRLMNAVVSEKSYVSDYKIKYDGHIEQFLEKNFKETRTDAGYPERGAAIKLLEGNSHFTDQFSDETKKLVEDYRVEFKKQHMESIEVHIARDRYGESGNIASKVISANVTQKRNFKDKISDITLKPITGIPILIIVLITIFVSVIYIGGVLEDFLVGLYELYLGPLFDQLALLIGGEIGEAISEGIYLSIEAILAIVIPFIVVFYLILGVLEDSGYLPRVAMLLDGIMVKLGLHGRAIIPMIVGTGCNVPAILATRTLESKRERLILSTVIVMAVPCSAQTIIIIGTVGTYSGIFWAALIYLILLGMIFILGKVLHKVLDDEPCGLTIEIPDLTMPSVKNVLYKTWARTKDFITIAFPLLLIGSLVLEFLMVYNVLDALVDPLSPFTVGFLGLPAIIIIALIMGVLRKEMALQILYVIFPITAGIDLSLALSPEQMFVFALIMATYMPCIAVLAVLLKEFGMKNAVLICISSICLSFLLGGLAHFLFIVF